jgi:hypothetical protein
MIINKKNYFHISKGADDIYYILNNGTEYLQNLSTDLDIAVIKAKNIIGSDVPVDIWYRQKTLGWKPQQDQHVEDHYAHLAKINFEKDKTQCQARQFVGAVNEKMICELECTLTYDVQGEWGPSRVVYLKDAQGNRFKYFGTAKAVWNFKKIGDKAQLEFVIKEHKFEDKYFKFDGVVPYNLNMIAKIKNPNPKEK